MRRVELLPPWEVLRTVEVGGGVTMLKVDEPLARWLIKHDCEVIPDPEDPEDGEIQKVCVPALHPDHVVVSEEPLTITPSLLCSVCGLHGFVTDGRWSGC